MRDTLLPVIKTNIPTVGGIATMFSDWEPAIRVVSLGVSTTLTILIFLREKRKQKQSEKETD